MRTKKAAALLILTVSLFAPVTNVTPGPRQQVAFRATRGTLFQNVVSVLEKKYYDKQFREDILPKLVSDYSARASAAKTLREQRNIVQEFLSHIPASHLGLLSARTHRRLFDDLAGKPYPTFGFQLMEIKGKFYTFFLLEGGPGERAGLLSWDRIVTIDGTPVEQSPRLDWRSDDAYIPDELDPPVHFLEAAQGESVALKVERQRGKFLNVTVKAKDYSAFAAAKASAKIYKTGDRSFGYLHFWYVHMTGVPELLRDKLEGEFSTCDGVVIDLRGRGGNGMAIAKIIDLLRADKSTRRRPIVALVDRQSRSAKDVLAYEMKRTGVARLVGERTAGAVIPATFADVGYETILMFPSFKLPKYTDLLESKPVEPDVPVERAGPLSAGSDPILKAGLAEALNLSKEANKNKRAEQK
ncbi:MAG TPA: S41 family peptidase [Blastocatellia bacterium]|nr:S41 family peptidase [Blastocatellia bacterium]